MLDTNKKTVHFDKAQYGHTHPSLVQLRTALTTAEKESPSRPPYVDPNEQRALELISKVKTEFQKSTPFTGWKEDKVLTSFNLQELIGSNV